MTVSQESLQIKTVPWYVHFRFWMVKNTAIVLGHVNKNFQICSWPTAYVVRVIY